MAPALRHMRMRGKQPQLDPRIERDGHGIKKIYLVTFPRIRVIQGLSCPTVRRRLRGKTSTGQVPLRSPSNFTREEIEEIMLDAASRPMYEDSRNQHHQKGVVLQKMGIFLELHKSEDDTSTFASCRDPHYHVALQGERSFRYLPMKKAIRVRRGFETHWSCTHDGYWSAVRYCAVKSPKKPQEELDPQPRLWARSGSHPPLLQACEEPVTAAAIIQRRRNAVVKAEEKGKAEPRVTEMDLYAAIVEGGFRNTPDDQHAWRKLITHLKETSAALYSYAFKMRTKLPGLINDVWAWERVGDVLAIVSMPRAARLEKVAGEACQCGGKWWTHAQQIFWNNGVCPIDFSTDVHRSLSQGRGPSTKVVVMAGLHGGEGKSFLFAPLRGVYGSEHVQESPQPGNFPLLGLEDKTVVLLDEWRFDESVLRMATQLLWYEGKPFPVTQPQNQAGSYGHFLYEGSAPLFVTTKEEDLARIETAARRAKDLNLPSQHTMLLRRLKVYKLHAPCPVADNVTIVECPSCFARMILQCSRGYGGPSHT